jgi:transposase InsO family protein
MLPGRTTANATVRGRSGMSCGDKVNRLFMADRPNKLWVSDFTYVLTWSGTVYVAFVIDVFARPSPWASDQWRHHGSTWVGVPRHR